MNPEFMHDDELTDDDLAFLNKWEKGIDESKVEPDTTIELDESLPEAEYIEGESDGDWDGGREVEGQDQGGSGSGLSGSSEKGEEVKGETDGEGQGEGEGGSDGESQDDSKMDISEVEQEQQSGDGESQAEAEQESDSDKQQELENELQEDQDQDQKSEQGKKGDQNYDDLPEGPPSCENHCEDNQSEDSKKPCPHCEERIRREREDWGCIAYDMHGNEILPGDKLKVKVPIAFMVSGSTLVANVPNTDVDPVRVAESTSGVVDDSICWLSGRAISQFTGWHMQGDGPIWTFQQGKKILFVEKAPQKQGGQKHEDNHQEGDNLDMEDMIEELQDDLEDFENQDENKKDDKDEEKDEDEHGAKLTQAQKDRFVKLTERIGTKTERTFGNTAEKFELCDPSLGGNVAGRTIIIESRGVKYVLSMSAHRMDKDD